MIETLSNIILEFPGAANRAQCLAHIKIILRQFDFPKKKKKNDSLAAALAPSDSNVPDLASGDQEDEPEINVDDDELVRVLDKEEKEMDEGDEGDDEESEKLERDVEKVEEAMEEEIKGVLKLKIAKPVRQVLFKVGTLGLDPLVLGILSFFFMLPLYAPFFRASFSRFLYMLLFFFLPFSSFPFFLLHRCYCYLMQIFPLFLSQLRKLAYAIKNSTTIILPRWNEVIEKCAATGTSTTKNLTVRKMPRDVATRWNSTCNMLKFAFTYSEPINNITADRSMKIHQYELKDHE